jgi:hypothetical protein
MFVTNFRRPRPRGPKEIHNRMQKHPRQLQPRELARPNRGPVPARTSSMVELGSAVRTITPRPGAVPHREVREFRDLNEAPDKILRNHTGRRRASRRLHHKKKTARNTNRTAHDEGRIQRGLPNVVERRPPSPRRTTSCRK